MRHLLVLLLTMTAALAGFENQYNTAGEAGKQAILEIEKSGKASYSRGSLNAQGTWKRVEEGKYAGTIAVTLTSQRGTKFTLYFQPDGRKMLGVNTATVDGVQIPDDTHVAVFD